MDDWGKLIFGLAAILTPLFSVQSFYDVSENDVNHHIYSHLRDVQILNPSPDGNFYPERAMTRAEALTVALRAGGISIPSNFNGHTYFSDVNPNLWYAAVIARGVTSGVLKDAGYKQFRPEQTVTKAEFLGFLFKSTVVNLDLHKSTRDIANDVPNSSWMTPLFAYARKYQIAHLPSDNFYLPNKSLTRREIAVMTYRQLRLFHGNNDTKLLIELQANINQFLNLIRVGKSKEAEFYVHRIMELNEKITLTKNNTDAIATRALSRSMEHLSDSLRYARFGKNLAAIENLHLALKQAKKAGQKSTAIKETSQELVILIGETLITFAGPNYQSLANK